MATINMKDPKASKAQFSPNSFQLHLGAVEEPVRIEAGTWRMQDHIGIRATFRGNDGRLYFGKQGYNIPLEDFEMVIVGMLQCYNEATGNQLTLHGTSEEDEARLDAVLEDVMERFNGSTETVHAWGK
jgi:hypothetical protein